MLIQALQIGELYCFRLVESQDHFGRFPEARAGRTEAALRDVGPDDAAPIDYALSRRLRGVARHKQEALKYAEAVRDSNDGEEESILSEGPTQKTINDGGLTTAERIEALAIVIDMTRA